MVPKLPCWNMTANICKPYFIYSRVCLFVRYQMVNDPMNVIIKVVGELSVPNRSRRNSESCSWVFATKLHLLWIFPDSASSLLGEIRVQKKKKHSRMSFWPGVLKGKTLLWSLCIIKRYIRHNQTWDFLQDSTSKKNRSEKKKTKAKAPTIVKIHRIADGGFGIPNTHSQKCSFITTLFLVLNPEFSSSFLNQT